MFFLLRWERAQFCEIYLSMERKDEDDDNLGNPFEDLIDDNDNPLDLEKADQLTVATAVWKPPPSSLEEADSSLEGRAVLTDEQVVSYLMERQLYLTALEFYQELVEEEAAAGRVLNSEADGSLTKGAVATLRSLLTDKVQALQSQLPPFQSASGLSTSSSSIALSSSSSAATQTSNNIASYFTPHLKRDDWEHTTTHTHKREREREQRD